MTAVGVHACTDVSGFGLLGHLGEMLDASGAGATLRVADVPLHDGVLDLIRQSVYAGGLRSNRDFLLPRLSGAVTTAAPAEEDARVLALFDPQTSGGLLMAVAAAKHAFLVEELEENGVGAWTIGAVTGAGAGATAGGTGAATGAICLEG